MFGGSDSAEVSDEAVRSRYDELRLWLVVSTAFAVSSFVMLLNMDKPLDMAGFVLAVHLLMALPVLYTFHRCSVLEEVRRALGQETRCGGSAHEPPCGGLFGTGSATSAFIAYFAAFSLSVYRLALLYTTCSFSKFRFHLQGFAVFQLVFAALLMAVSVFLVELAKRTRLSALYL